MTDSAVAATHPDVNQGLNFTPDPIDIAFARKLQKRLPARIFDAHAHAFHVDQLGLPEPAPGMFGQLPRDCGFHMWRAANEAQLGSDRLKGGLLFPFPTANCDADAANAFLRDELDKHPDCRGLILLRPTDSREDALRWANHPQIAGIKVYHVYSDEKPTFHSSLEGFLPEWMWQLAHDNSWCIMLHIVKDGAIADADNQRSIRQYCEKYPKAKLILAHCARSFCAWNNVDGLAALAGLENVWFDTSGICEADAITPIIRHFGPSKLMFGSDWPISDFRGKCVSVGNGFSWIDPGFVDAKNPAAGPNPSLMVGLESVRAVLHACEQMHLSSSDIEDVFYNNAARLLGLEAPSQNTGQRLYDHAKSRIPGGVQLLSKRPENALPEQWPAYFREARGCEIRDLDHNHYYDFTHNGVGSCLLGFNDPDISDAVIRRIQLGNMCSLNTPEEVELADLLCEIHPWAQSVRFTRSGGETMAAAVRIARATTGRDMIAVCGYHGWHDWYLAANLGDSDSLKGHLLPGLQPDGVPAALRGSAQPFTYGDREALSDIIRKHGDRLAAVVMEPMRYTEPPAGYLEFVRDSIHKAGGLLVLDEITIGWRTNFGGAHLRLGITPDIACFAKATSNGFPMGAVIGTREAMHGANGSFISSTYWTEGVGPTAALATIRKMQRVNVAQHVRTVGLSIAAMWRNRAAAAKLPITVVDTCPALMHFKWDCDQPDVIRTLFTQLMLDRGFLAGQAVYCTLAHNARNVALYEAAVAEAFDVIADALAKGDAASRLRGPVAHSGFTRLVS